MKRPPLLPARRRRSRCRCRPSGPAILGATAAISFLLVVAVVSGSVGALAFFCSPAARRTTASPPVIIANGGKKDRGTITTTAASSSTLLRAAGVGGGGGLSGREMEIKRKIARLKREGRMRKNKRRGAEYGDLEDLDDDLDDSDDETAQQQKRRDDEYTSKIRRKLGDAKSKMLGYVGEGDDGDLEVDGDESKVDIGSEMEQAAAADDRAPQIGSLSSTVAEETSPSAAAAAAAAEFRPEGERRKPIIDPSLFEGDGDGDGEPELSEEELVDLVAQKMAEKREKERREKEAKMKDKARELLDRLDRERRELSEKQQQQQQQQGSTGGGGSKQQQQQLTSGVGGSWTKTEDSTENKEELYQPKTGSWGAFPRPRDISKAYGGGRRVGSGYSDEEERLRSEEDTRERLKRYREKVGIEVQSEKENARTIDEALSISNAAMQRGMYSTAVSALEKVTRYCSTNSKVGGKVYLELAMAYEAVGKTSEAITVYTELAQSRIEDIKFNAKRLLYGLEAMQFMRDDVKSSSFDRKKIKSTFIDTTGLANIASNFDDVYQTAYIDLEGNSYKRLTESVVRSAREARQILLKATDSGEVGRLRVVQALRSLSRKFDDALMSEVAETPEPVAFINGKPLMSSSSDNQQYGISASLSGAMGEEFVLADADTMIELLAGEWRLQLLADKRGDGVRYFNSTLSWQSVDTGSMTFSSAGPAGFVTVQQSGDLDFNAKKRILRRKSVELSGGGVFTGLFGGKLKSSGGPVGAVRTPQQVMSVDSVLLVTRGVPNRRTRQLDDEKDYFAVWRRVEPGTYSGLRRDVGAANTSSGSRQQTTDDRTATAGQQ